MEPVKAVAVRETRQMGKMTAMDAENTSRSFIEVSRHNRGISTIPPPPPNRPLIAPAQLPAIIIPYCFLQIKRTPPVESFSTGGFLILIEKRRAAFAALQK
jgi:hypothetical protein